MASFNLKALFTADTSGLKKGSKEAQQSVKDFEKTTEGALDNVLGLFGTSMSSIQTSLSTLRGGLLSLTKAFSSTSTAATGTSKAMQGLKIAIASTGIGALVVAFGSLVAYFTKSQRGADLLSKILAPLKQTFATLTDFAVLLGEKIVWCFENPKKALTDFVDSLKNNITNRVAGLIGQFSSLGKIVKGIFTLDWDEMKQGMQEYAGSLQQVITGISPEQWSDVAKTIGGAYDEIAKKNERAIALESRRQELVKKQRDFLIEEANLDNEIARQREIAADKNNRTNEERLAAILKAQELTNTKAAKQKDIAQEELYIIQETNALSESMNQDLDAEAKKKVEIINLDTRRSTAMKELLATQKEIQNSVDAEKKATDQLLSSRQELKELDLSVSADTTQLKDKILGEGAQIVLPIQPVIDTKKWEEIVDEVATDGTNKLEELNKTLSNIMSSMSEGIAGVFSETIQGLVAGELSMKDIFGSLLSFIGENMIKIGEALIAYGIAMESFKKAFSNPWAAIAAGAALIAAGAVLNAMVSNFNAGSNVSSSASISSIAAGGTVSIPATVQYSQSTSQEVNVNVSGKFELENNKLVAAIKKENNRTLLTT